MNPRIHSEHTKALKKKPIIYACKLRYTMQGVPRELGQDLDNSLAYFQAKAQSSLQVLCNAYFMELGSFTLQNDHCHIIIRTNPQACREASDQEVIRRWQQLHPPSPNLQNPESPTFMGIQGSKRCTKLRKRLLSVLWFCRCFSRLMSNSADQMVLLGLDWHDRYQCNTSVLPWEEIKDIFNLEPLTSQSLRRTKDMIHSLRWHSLPELDCSGCAWQSRLNHTADADLADWTYTKPSFLPLASRIGCREIEQLIHYGASQR